MSIQTTFTLSKQVVLSLTMILLFCTAALADGLENSPVKTTPTVITTTGDGANCKVVVNTTDSEPTTVKVIHSWTKEVIYSEKLQSNQNIEKVYKLNNLVSGNYTIEVKSGLKTFVKEVHVR